MAHTEDIESHIRSIEEDAEYWRTKRLEPRIIRLLRRGKISFFDLVRGSQGHGPIFELEPLTEEGELEAQIAALELRLGDYIKGINIAAAITGNQVLVEEGREEAGVYDESLRFEHRKTSGTEGERVAQLRRFLEEDIATLNALFGVLVARSEIREDRLKEMLAAPKLPNYENGARIVAKAWLDDGFKGRLIGDAKRTLREMGFALNRTPKLLVVEDTASLHNVIVCTLCSCYPYELLGNPPWWYKHDSYKQAIIADPRQTLREMFKFELPADTDIRVYDSTSDIRYMVLPRRPDGTGGMEEGELAKLVTEESLIGVGGLRKPMMREGAAAQR